MSEHSPSVGETLAARNRVACESARTGARRLLCVLIPLVGCLGLLAPERVCAQATSADVEARALFERARAAYRERRWQQALQLLQAGQQLSPRSGFWFNIGQAQLRLGRCADAAASYMEYLKQADLQQRMRERAVRAVAELTHCTESTRRASPEPPMQPTPKVAPPLESRDRPVLQLARWTLLVGGAGLGLGAAYLALRANAYAGELEHASSWTAELSEKQRAGQSAATTSLVFASLGVVAMGAAAVLFVHASGRETLPAAVVTAALTPKAVSVGFVRRF